MQRNEVLALLQKVEPNAVVGFACACARLVAPFQKTRPPDDAILREAVEAAQRIADGADFRTADPVANDIGARQLLSSYDFHDSHGVVWTYAARTAFCALHAATNRESSISYALTAALSAEAAFGEEEDKNPSAHERLDLLKRIDGAVSVKEWQIAWLTRSASKAHVSA